MHIHTKVIYFIGPTTEREGGGVNIRTTNKKPNAIIFFLLKLFLLQKCKYFNFILFFCFRPFPNINKVEGRVKF